MNLYRTQWTRIMKQKSNKKILTFQQRPWKNEVMHLAGDGGGGRQAGGQETIIDQAARPPSTCQNDKTFQLAHSISLRLNRC